MDQTSCLHIFNISLVLFCFIQVISAARTTSTTTPTTTKAPSVKLPDIPNAIHYPIYIPDTTMDSLTDSSFLSPTFDMMGMSSNAWSSALSPLTSLSSSPSSLSSSFPSNSYDWMSQPLVEVYDEQTLLRNREKLRQRRMEAMRSREQMRQAGSDTQRYVHRQPVINSYNSNYDRNDHNAYLNDGRGGNIYRNNNHNYYGSSSSPNSVRKEHSSVRHSWQSEQEKDVW